MLYVLLPLVNKETTLAYGRAEHSKKGKTKLNAGRKKVESGRRHVAAEGWPQKPQTRGENTD